MTRKFNSGQAVPLSETNRAELSYYRRRRGLLQRELAERLGVTKQHVSDVETGRRDPSQDLLTRWCTELGLSCDVQTVVRINGQ